MGYRIQLPTAGYLGAVQNNVITTTTNADVTVNSIYVLGGTTAYTLMLPQSLNSTGTNYNADLRPGDIIYMKRLTNPMTITVSRNEDMATIDGVQDNILITDNQPLTLIYISDAPGTRDAWLVA